MTGHPHRPHASHTPDATHGPADAGDGPQEAADFWEQHYARVPADWGSRPNASLVRLVGEHGVVPPAPGARALDLGAGHGGDAVWLAAAGWSVTAADLSTTALARVEALARDHGVGHRVVTERHDLAVSIPAGPFALVTSCFFQTPLQLDRDAVLRRAAQAVQPGGWLLVVDHAAAPSWAGPDHHGHEFPAAAATLANLELGDGWVVTRCERVTRTGTGPEGQQGELVDNLVLARRS